MSKPIKNDRKMKGESENIYKTILETLPWKIYFKDKNLVYSACNKGYASDFGKTPDEITGKTDYDLYPKELAEKHRAVDRQILKSGKTIEFEEEYVKDSQTFWVYKIKTPIKDDEDRIIGILGIVADITERKRAEETAVEARAFAESIIATVREPLLVLNADLRVITANRSFYEVFKVKQEETEGQLLYELGNRQWNISRLRDLLESILPKKTEFNNFKVEHNFKEIGQKTMLLNARRIFRETNRTQMILLAIEDTTERKRAEEELKKQREHLEELEKEHTAQLEASNKDLETFAYSVSHDLRTPLRAIDGFSRILLEDHTEKLDDEGKRVLNVIRNNTGRMGQLIDDILSFSRLGRMEMSVFEIDMEQLARSVVNDLKPTLNDRNVELIIDTLPPSQGDKAMIRVVIVNLINNAIKFTRPRTVARIEIGGRTENNENSYFVRDNGVGFDMNYQNKLFGVFQRLHSQDEFEGTGIGLAIVKQVITRHGGRVWAEGKVDEGAAFYFTLPRMKGKENEHRV